MVIDKIINVFCIGEIGDGKIFVFLVDKIVWIWIGEDNIDVI